MPSRVPREPPVQQATIVHVQLWRDVVRTDLENDDTVQSDTLRVENNCAPGRDKRTY
jgi:hypothetical protein